MSSSRALTGGTKDVNPQYFRMQVDNAGTTTASTESAIPVQRLNNKNRSMVMEILKVQFLTKHVSDTKDEWVGIATSKPPTGKPDAMQGYWVCLTKINAASPESPVVDLTDGAGHGVLVAADKLFFAAYADTAKADRGVVALILYRWKNVSLSEYIGIVQASQL